MGKQWFELCQNINNSNISLYQMYLQKSHKNILKYYRLNLFKEIAIYFHHSFQMALQSPASLSKKLLV